MVMSPKYQKYVVTKNPEQITKLDMDPALPGYRLHQLKGDKQDMWSVWVNGNWRMTVYVEGQDAYLVDYMDYH